MDRLKVIRIAAGLTVLAALATTAVVVYRWRDAERATALQRAETERTRKAFIQAAEAAERAAAATTPPEVLQARKDAALREFRAAETEMLLQQTRARLAREERQAAAGNTPGPGASAPGP